MIIVNGQKRPWTAGMTVADLLEELGVNSSTVVVELNQSQIITQVDYETTQLQDGDHLEVVSFVGGG